MDQAVANYVTLINAFISGTLSATEFETQFLDLFKAETRPMDDRMFEILNALFISIDDFVADRGLYRDLVESGGTVINEAELKKAARTALVELEGGH